MKNDKIVLVEDDPLLIEMYKTKFKSEGLEVLTAQEGESGLKLIQKTLPSVVVLDLTMPKKNGLEVLQIMNQSEETKNIPVILLTNSSQGGETKKALEFGVKEYLIKATLTPSEIVAKVKKYL